MCVDSEEDVAGLVEVWRKVHLSGIFVRWTAWNIFLYLLADVLYVGFARSGEEVAWYLDVVSVGHFCCRGVGSFFGCCSEAQKYPW